MISTFNCLAAPLQPDNIAESGRHRLWRREGRFLMLDLFIDTTSPLTLVTNWHTELRK